MHLGCKQSGPPRVGWSFCHGFNGFLQHVHPVDDLLSFRIPGFDPRT